MTERRPVECWLTDMDGVLVREDQALPGAADFIAIWTSALATAQFLADQSTGGSAEVVPLVAELAS